MHKDFNFFNKIKKLGVTLGPMVPNNYQVPKATDEMNKQRTKAEQQTKRQSAAQAHRAAHHILKQKSKSSALGSIELRREDKLWAFKKFSFKKKKNLVYKLEILSAFDIPRKE